MTDYVLMGLLVAIVIVGVLLLSCWKTKPRRRVMRRRRDPFVSGVVETDGKIRPTGGAVMGEMGELLESGGTSPDGTAKQNSNYQNRENVIADDLKSYDDYNDVIKFMSLGGAPSSQKEGYESSVFESQKQWVKNTNHVTSTASMQSERDDLGGLPNGYVGLQRPNFTDHPGIEASARQDSTFTPDQMPMYRHFVL